MKRILILFIIFIANMPIFAQTDGISYQAVIIDPDAKEIPGVDVVGNILPNATISIRFTIFDANNTEEFTEVQTTETDQYGMINLVIGVEDHDGFTSISWDGTAKDLKVDIDFSGTGSDFLDLSRQALLFAPYAYHRNITATGTLDVDGTTNLNNELIVDGPTNLNSSLDVNNINPTNLTGTLSVDEATNLNNTLTVVGKTDLMDSLNVNLSPSLFDGKITVEDSATFNGPAAFNAPVDFVEITVNGPSHLNGQVNVNANMDTIGDEMNYNAYPLLVQGSSQGIAVKVNGARSGVNNYISFWDTETGAMWGRIEGQTIADLSADPEHMYEVASNAVDVGLASADVVVANADIVVAAADLGIAVVETVQAGVSLTAASTSSTACAGLGACVTAPVPSFIVSETANLVVAIANAVVVTANLALVVANAVIVDGNLVKVVADGTAYETFITDNIGVTYQSGSGDYAEWLPKANPTDKFLAGDLVGLKNGYITKSTSGVDKVMVISTNPIVLGNMPQENNEKNYEKIAFIGQVPVRVIGKVEPGDYILPTIYGGGFGKAVNPDEMNITDYKKIVGVAWSGADGENINIINVAVGLNTNDLSNVIQNQKEEINFLQSQINNTNLILSQLVPGYSEALNEEICIPIDTTIANKTVKENYKKNEYADVNIITPTADDIIYVAPTRSQMLEAIKMTKTSYLESGKSIDDHPFWKKMRDEPAYKEEILQFIEGEFNKAIKTQKAVDRKLSQQ